MEYRYTAIVLKKREVGETDRLYTLYTKEQGKIRVVAKGIRKPEAKLASQLENGTFCHVTVARTRGTGRITSALAENHYPMLRTNLGALRSLLLALDRFERLVHLEEKDTDLFSVLQEYIECLETDIKNGNGDGRLLTTAFLFQSMRQLGYAMEARVSVSSGRVLCAGEHFVFSPAQGGVLLRSESDDVETLPIHQNSVKILRVFQTHPLKTVMRIRVSENELREIERITQYLFEWILS